MLRNNIKIGYLVFGGGDNTLGMEIIVASIKDAFPDLQLVGLVDHSTAKHVDILLVSLYWYKNIYDFIQFLNTAGIDPRKKKPIIIIGGMAALNPFILSGYFHYAVL